MAELSVENLVGVQIFDAGQWTDSAGNKASFAPSDLDEMVANFVALSGKVKPFLKLMHLSPADHRRVTAAPALGWMTSLRRDGTKLVADFANVPRKVAMLIRAGTYRRISAEIFRQFKDESSGKIFKNVVSAAGLLGATHPAVNTLDDVFKLFELSDELAKEEYILGLDASLPWNDCSLHGPENGNAAMVFTLATNEQKNNTRGGVDMDEMKALEDRLIAKFESTIKANDDKHVAQFTEFKASIAGALGVDGDADLPVTISRLKKEVADKDAAINDNAAREFKSSIDAVFDAAKKDGKLVPAEESVYRAIATSLNDKIDTSGKVEFSINENDKPLSGSPVDVMKAIFEKRAQVVVLNKEAGAAGGDKIRASVPLDVARQAGETGIPSKFSGFNEEAKIRKYMSENKCDWLAAFQAVNELTVSEPDPMAYSISGDNVIRT